MRPTIAPIALLIAAIVAFTPAAASAQSASAQLLTSQARDHLARGDLILARKRLHEAVALDPGHVPAWLELASLRERAGELDEALRLYDLALERNPVSPALHLARAHLLERRGRLDEAAYAIRSAVGSAPNDRGVRTDAEAFYVRRRNWAAALQESRAILWMVAPAEREDARLHALALQVLAQDLDPVRAGRRLHDWQRRAIASIARRTGGL